MSKSRDGFVEEALVKLNLKVMLPSGEVAVPVDEISTPGHLKENLKYSIRLPPKHFKLLVDGVELDDIKTFVDNGVKDGATVVCQAREGHEVEALEAEAQKEKAPVQPTMIRKEEPPKPKKPKKDVVRPTLVDGDVVKKDVLQQGRKAWKKNDAYLAARSPRRHMVFVRLTANDDDKTYPEQETQTIALALGDPQTSPVWAAAVEQMELGEKAVFQMNRKAVDFDPEGLNPTDSSALWTVELVRVVEVEDLLEDFSQLLEVASGGGPERVEDLDRVAVHWRVRRWMAEGQFCIASSRERIAIMPGYGLVPIEDTNAPPTMVSVGEGQQEAIECIVYRVGPGGKGHLYLKTEAMKGNRPQGCVIMDIELVAMDPCRGPGSPGYKGWTSIISEQEMGDQWLEEADGRRKQLETFSTMKKSTGDSKGAEESVAQQVHKFANNSSKRYRRALQWLEADDAQEGEKKEKKKRLESATLKMRIAKATTLAHQRFGDDLQTEASAEETSVVQEARTLLTQVLEAAESMANESIKIECLKMSLHLCIQAEDVEGGKQLIQTLTDLLVPEEELKSDSARLNRMQKDLELKAGGGTIEDLQKELRAANAEDPPNQESASKALASILELMQENKVTFNTVRDLKVGKDVGNAMKLGIPELAAEARKVVGEIQALAKRNEIGL